MQQASKEERLKFIRKYFFHGIPYVFESKETDYFEFRNRIVEKFEISFQEVFIVGSAKFGFSPTIDKGHKLGKVFDEDSDIDVVLVNQNLFDEYHIRIRDFQYRLDKQKKLTTEDEYNKYINFLKYFAKGWMRPDLLPTSFQMNIIKEDWFEFFKTLSNNGSEVGNYKVNAGLYKNYLFLEKYYEETIETYYEFLVRKKDYKK